jgi:hypothetical protein
VAPTTTATTVAPTESNSASSQLEALAAELARADVEADRQRFTFYSFLFVQFVMFFMIFLVFSAADAAELRQKLANKGICLLLYCKHHSFLFFFSFKFIHAHRWQEVWRPGRGRSCRR